MSRNVFCRLYQQEMPGLTRPPFPGPEGEAIFTEVSQQAWSEWLRLQTMLINEKRLRVTDPEARKFLAQQREAFFSGAEVETAKGYTPPANESL